MTPIIYSQWRDARLAEFHEDHSEHECNCDNGKSPCHACGQNADCEDCGGKGVVYYDKETGHSAYLPSFTHRQYKRSVMRDFVTISKWTKKSHYKQAKQFLSSFSEYTR